MRSNIEGARIGGNLLVEGNKLGYALLASTADFALSSGMPPLLSFSSTQALNVKLPATATKGAFHVLLNPSTNLLTLQTSTGGALGFAATIRGGAAAIVVGDGTAWRGVFGTST